MPFPKPSPNLGASVRNINGSTSGTTTVSPNTNFPTIGNYWG